MLTFWSAALGLSLLLYVLLDGFDLGIGVLFLFAPSERHRRHMMDAVSPVWDGNETWLIISGATLFGVFPAAYAILLGAFYIPVIVMLCGLILRGVAFEFRSKTLHMRWLWTLSFGVGSIVAAFTQGAAIGAFVQELPVRDGIYVGSAFSWVSWYSILCGFGLVFGYALLGACWLIHKTETEVRDFGYAVMPRILAGLAAFLVLAAIGLFAFHMRVAGTWFERPWLLVPLAVGALAGALLVYGVWKRIDRLPLPMTVVMFVAAFVTMVGSLLPFIVPFSLTIAEAAAPPASLAFMFWGIGLVIYPVTLIYTAAVYWVFRGKVQPLGEYEGDDLPEPGSVLAEATVAVELARRDLASTMADLKSNLTPAHVMEDASRAGRAALGAAVHRGAEIARTPEGAAAIGLGAMALLRAFLRPRQPKR
ncbi:cytochrome d ubiquinol oxidase subunit II [Lichenibacterium dinghuense]|uniref:cytochrome d ubiquinol oxidase subunit II n=1 Tax=Lichenibacterium dinghuense TaxID=2895977 RepID=UPI00281568E7|nr:cytochrome d ubiquinol oxidase subunit II [Lichenibacterium sp. 6Y81]